MGDVSPVTHVCLSSSHVCPVPLCHRRLISRDRQPRPDQNRAESQRLSPSRESPTLPVWRVTLHGQPSRGGCSEAAYPYPSPDDKTALIPPSVVRRWRNKWAPNSVCSKSE